LFIIYAVKPCQADYIRFYKKKNHKKNLLFQTDFISDFYIFVIIPFCL